VGTIADIARLQVDEVRRVGPDVLVDARPDGPVDELRTSAGALADGSTPQRQSLQEGAV